MVGGLPAAVAVMRFLIASSRLAASSRSNSSPES
jgi:hypothetical protein